jgi:Phosphate-induced protein 1 conserved region
MLVPIHRLLPIGAAALALAACSEVSPPLAPASSAPADVTSLAKTQPRPTGTGIGTIGSSVDRTHQRVEYHGGPMMFGTTNVYLIWYGSWVGNNAPTILTDLVQSIGGSSYFDIVTRYRNIAGVAPSNAVSYGGSIDDAYSLGSTLTAFDIGTIVGVTLAGGSSLPIDPNGVYVVLTSADVSETSGFGTSYCGFHNLTEVSGVVVQYVFIGHPDRAPAQCEPQSVGPNGNTAADVDPRFTAWYDKFMFEPADKCAWNFGTIYTVANGASANVRLGSRDFLLQQQWVLGNRGFCTLDASATP